MIFRVVATHRAGVPIDRTELAIAEGVVGQMTTADRELEMPTRTSTVARLINVRGDSQIADLLPPLFDVQLLTMAPNGMMLRGVERADLGEGRYAEYAQGWWARPAD